MLLTVVKRRLQAGSFNKMLHMRTSTLSALPAMQRMTNFGQMRAFSSDNKSQSYSPSGEVEVEIENASGDSSSEVLMQYHLVPMRDHPIFPGSSMATAITKEQYQVRLNPKLAHQLSVSELTLTSFCLAYERHRDCLRLSGAKRRTFEREPLSRRING